MEIWERWSKATQKSKQGLMTKRSSSGLENSFLLWSLWRKTTSSTTTSSLSKDAKISLKLTICKGLQADLRFNLNSQRNILVDEIKNSILLADFGEAQLANKFNTLTIRGGTGIYMAPERHLSAGDNSSTASDVWSIFCGIKIIWSTLKLNKRVFEKGLTE